MKFSPGPPPVGRPLAVGNGPAGRGGGGRISRKGIAPLGSRWANYKVEKEALTGNAPYRATVRLVAGMVPVNLVHAIQEVGFDYGMSAREVAAAIRSRHTLLWEYQEVIDPAQGPERFTWVSQQLLPSRWERSPHHDLRC